MPRRGNSQTIETSEGAQREDERITKQRREIKSKEGKKQDTQKDTPKT